jgi:hypothetical protein
VSGLNAKIGGVLKLADDKISQPVHSAPPAGAKRRRHENANDALSIIPHHAESFLSRYDSVSRSQWITS